MMRAAAWVLWAAAVAGAQDADTYYREGVALAREQKWAEARAALEAGARVAPGDARFPLGLAGIAFSLEQWGEARREVRAALRLDPGSAYANEFLGALFALDENWDAALRYWNRAGQPVAAGRRVPADLRLRAALLENALVFGPVGLVRREEYLEARARLDLLGVFPRYRFGFTPQAVGERFDVEFHALERNGWGPPGVARYVGPLRGVFFQALLPEYTNAGGRAVNVRSLVRWDRHKQRLAADVAAPAGDEAAGRQRFYFDFRRESWDLSRSDRVMGGELALRKAAAGYGLRRLVSHRVSWWTEMELNWRSIAGDRAFTGGSAPVVRAGVDATLWNVPERRFRVEGSGSVEAGRMWRGGLGAYVKNDGAMRAEWLPRARGEDLALRGSLRAGRAAGEVPFDELYVLGVERDTDLWMRGRAGTERGRKGSAPMGREYVLASLEWDKVLRRGAFWGLTAGPLVDSGQVWDARGRFGSPLWMSAVGVQARVRVLTGPEVTLSWARDVRGGGGTFYATVGRAALLPRP